MKKHEPTYQYYHQQTLVEKERHNQNKKNILKEIRGLLSDVETQTDIVYNDIKLIGFVMEEYLINKNNYYTIENGIVKRSNALEEIDFDTLLKILTKIEEAVEEKYNIYKLETLKVNEEKLSNYNEEYDLIINEYRTIYRKTYEKTLKKINEAVAVVKEEALLDGYGKITGYIFEKYVTYDSERETMVAAIDENYLYITDSNFCYDYETEIEYETLDVLLNVLEQLEYEIKQLKNKTL